MASLREKKRTALREKLIDAAAARIEQHGLPGFRARDAAADVGCALGSIYTVFEDLDGLILQVNARTLSSLGAALNQADTSGSPGEVLANLALSYARFARGNFNLWSALFDHRMADGGPSPDWLLNSHAHLLKQLAAPIRALQPALSDEDLDMRARACFAAVHGIVSISLQKRFLGLPEDRLEPELKTFVDQVVAGMK